MLILGLAGLFVYKNFIYSDPDYGCYIKVIPSFQPSNWDFHKILTLIKKTDPNSYSYMCKNVDTISKDISCGGLDGGCFYTNKSKTIFIGNDQNNIAVTAAIVVHELCHVKQFNEGRNLVEPECYTSGAHYLSNLYLY